MTLLARMSQAKLRKLTKLAKARTDAQASDDVSDQSSASGSACTTVCVSWCVSWCLIMWMFIMFWYDSGCVEGMH